MIRFREEVISDLIRRIFVSASSILSRSAISGGRPRGVSMFRFRFSKFLLIAKKSRVGTPFPRSFVFAWFYSCQRDFTSNRNQENPVLIQAMRYVHPLSFPNGRDAPIERVLGAGPLQFVGICIASISVFRKSIRYRQVACGIQPNDPSFNRPVDFSKPLA